MMLPRVIARLRIASRVIRDGRIPLWRRLLWPALGLLGAALVALPGPNPVADALAASVIGIPVDGAGFVLLGVALAPWLTIHGVARRHPDVVAEHQGRHVTPDLTDAIGSLARGGRLADHPDLARLQRKLVEKQSAPLPAPDQRQSGQRAAIGPDFGGIQ